MKCLSLWQPWASLMAFEEKRFETRSWETLYRGVIAIQASQYWSRELAELCREEPFATALRRHGITDARRQLPFGAIVSACRLWGCVPAASLNTRYTELSEKEKQFGNYTAGRYVFKTEKNRRLPEPIQVRGYQKIFELKPYIGAAVSAAVDLSELWKQ